MVKPLNKEILHNFILPKRKAGYSIASITRELNKQGFTTKTGLQLCNAATSHFLVDNGFRTHRRKIMRRSSAKAINPAPRAIESRASASASNDDLLLDIIASNLNRAAKIKLLTSLI